MTTFLFIANYYKTPLWSAIADDLRLQGHHALHLSISPYWAKWLRNRGSDKAGCHVIPVPPISSLVKSSESDDPWETACGIPLGTLASIDRVIGRLGQQRAVRYLHGFSQFAREVLENFVDPVVVSEATWAHELVLAEVAGDVGARWVMPHTVRYPRGYLGFFLDPFESSLAEVPGDELALSDAQRELLAIQLGAPPDYSLTNERFRATHSRPLPRAFAKASASVRYRRRDPSVPNFRQYVSGTGALARLRRSLKSAPHIERMRGGTPSEPFVLLALHRQPEASVDIRGWAYRNQLRFIEEVRATLDSDLHLVVKEHPDAIGDRSGGFYTAVEKMKGVELMHPSASMREAMNQACGVASISGTASYEAGLLGKPSMVMAPVFFTRLPSVKYVDGYRAIQDWAHLLHGSDNPRTFLQNSTSAVNWLQSISGKTINATASDVLSDPSTLDARNVASIAAGLGCLTRGQSGTI